MPIRLSMMVPHIIPGVNRPYGAESPALNQHFLRYGFAFCYVHNHMSVLDVACGAGYGTSFLAQRGAQVVGLDLDEKIINYAQESYKQSNIQYLQADAEDLPFPDTTFDLVVSLETIEHLPEPESFLREAVRVLKGPQLLVASVPIIPTCHFDRFHLHDFTKDEFVDLLNSCNFKLWDILIQDNTFLTVVASLAKRPVIPWPRR